MHFNYCDIVKNEVLMSNRGGIKHYSQYFYLDLFTGCFFFFFTSAVGSFQHTNHYQRRTYRVWKKVRRNFISSQVSGVSFKA